MSQVKQALSLDGRVAVITGGAGLLGVKHAEAIAEMGGIPVLLDLDAERAESAAQGITDEFSVKSFGLGVDITDPESVKQSLEILLKEVGRVDILINNAANNPKMESSDSSTCWSRLENFPIGIWEKDIAVGLTGAFLCSRVFGEHMAEKSTGVILNVASDLGVIAPDQRIYRQEGLAEQQQPVKPVTYSVVKSGLIGLTKYLATYWAEQGVRANAIAPGGVYAGQPAEFVEKLTNLIPLGRMAKADEYKAAVVFLVSDASSYMTGATINMDGGRTCW